MSLNIVLNIVIILLSIQLIPILQHYLLSARANKSNYFQRAAPCGGEFKNLRGARVFAPRSVYVRVADAAK